MELEEQKLEPFKGQARLRESAVPKRYDLIIKLDLSACTFSGSVLIDASIYGVTKVIVLNALELVIGQVSFTSSQKQKYVPSDFVVDGDDEILVLVFEEALDVGYGTTFKITLESIPSELTALSNIPISEEKLYGHLKTVQFEESILMSTYLVAIVVAMENFGLITFCETELLQDDLHSAAANVQRILTQSLELVRTKARWIEHIEEEKEVLAELVKELSPKQ
ncbi:UNVERIFIED_CONTAM: Aminopeptidase M1 [Sesamum radiatum]|uniref:Aminopeptidase M1 n=1 Tax=Sesamum radiatum TaxID=300843 RepID=A0AAW2PF64_SESRA